MDTNKHELPGENVIISQASAPRRLGVKFLFKTLSCPYDCGS
jgi:hypothetical protein